MKSLFILFSPKDLTLIDVYLDGYSPKDLTLYQAFEGYFDGYGPYPSK